MLYAGRPNPYIFARHPSSCYALGGGVTGRKLPALSGNVGTG